MIDPILLDLPASLQTERLMLRPAFNVSGFASGYTGAGAKTIIYKEALAKADVRLVGGQDPAKVFEAIREFARARGYHGIEIRNLKATPASRTPLDHSFVPKVKAATTGFPWCADLPSSSLRMSRTNTAGAESNTMSTELLSACCFLSRQRLKLSWACLRPESRQ